MSHVDLPHLRLLLPRLTILTHDIPSIDTHLIFLLSHIESLQCIINLKLEKNLPRVICCQWVNLSWQASGAHIDMATLNASIDKLDLLALGQEISESTTTLHNQCQRTRWWRKRWLPATSYQKQKSASHHLLGKDLAVLYFRVSAYINCVNNSRWHSILDIIS